MGKYYCEWVKEPKESSNYYMWDCGTRYEIIIVQYKDKPNFWYVEYVDCWTIPLCANYPRVEIRCLSLHDAKIMADKSAKECEIWLNKPMDNLDLT